MPAYHVDRSVTIDADESRVRAAVEDFREWPKWSPWLCMEPDAKLDYYGTPGEVGHGYDWDGELVGAGGMKIASLGGGRQQMELSFLRPFKSKADVLIEIKPVGESQTEVTWHMDGKLPFFMFFMVGMMKTMIGMDYTRGLKMLKEYVETGEVLSHIEIVGVVDVPQFNYLGVEARCAMSEMGDSMKQTLPAAHRCATDNNIEISGPPGALYHKVNMKHGQCHYTAIMQTVSPAEVNGYESGTLGPCKAIKIVHTGSYQHLGNAWSAAMSYEYYKKGIKRLKSLPSFEFYPNDPHETPEKDWLTEIFVPVRG